MELQGYKFYPRLDSPGNDALSSTSRDINELRKQCDLDDNCVAFNTAGYLKYKLEKLIECKFFKSDSSGIYVKDKFAVNAPKIRIKMMCNWCSCWQLCQEWKHMSKGGYVWNNIEITWEDDADYFVIINKPIGANEYFVPERTVVFHMEPWCGDTTQSWGVKTWGKWAEPDENIFLQVRSHKNFYNNAFWQLRTTYSQFKNQPIKKDPSKVLSTICSSKYFDPGHIKRIDFIKYMDTHGTPIDIYNHDNKHKFKNYVGPHPKGYKDAGMLQYKYYFMGENNVEENFITEKVWEPLIAECVCFYWGCPNVTEYIDSRAFIVLDLDDIEGSFKVVMDAIENNEWEKRIEIIRREKQKVLDYFQFFPTIERVLEHDFKLSKNSTTEEVRYHKFFYRTIGRSLNKICFVYASDLKQVEIIKNHAVFKVLDYVYVINTGPKMEEIVHPKISVINYRDTDGTTMRTIEFMEMFSKYNRDCQILYIGKSGILSDYQSYFMLDNFLVCSQLLNLTGDDVALREFSAVGLDCLDDKFGSIDTFWTNSDFVNENRLARGTTNEKVTIDNWVNPETSKFFSVCDMGKEDGLLIRGSYDNSDMKQKMNNYINNNKNYKTVCVNLARRADRKAEMVKLFEQTGIDNYEFFEAVDGKNMTVTDEIVEMFEGNDFGSKRGYIGCALSHYNIWKQLVDDTDNDYYYVCEDDITVADDFKFKLDMILARINNIKTWDIAHLGYSMYYAKLYQNFRKYRSNEISQLVQFDPNTYIGGTFSYLISKSGAQKMLNFIENNGIKHGIDYLAKRYHKEMELIQYEASPHLVYSEWIQNGTDVDSDIQRDSIPLFSEKVLTVEDIYNKHIKEEVTEDGVVCFVHSCTFNNNASILEEIIDMLTSEEFDIYDRIYVINFGNSVACSNEKVTVINWSKDTKQFEKPTLNLVKYFAERHDSKILYLHTKGVTHGGNLSKVINDWRNYMLYFLVECGKDCLRVLNKYDIVGVNYQQTPHKHYSGNFWWSNSKHIRLLDSIESNVRHDCEWWIMTKDNENYVSLYNTEVDHYRTTYPREKYDSITLENFIADPDS